MRLVNLPSMSSFWRLYHCNAWPELGEGHASRTSKGEIDRSTRMAIGSWVHYQIAAHLRGEAPPPVPTSWLEDPVTEAGRQAFEETVAAACATVERWCEWYAEQGGFADAWDVAIEQPLAFHALDGTARVLMLSGARAYEEDLEAFEIPGTPDLAFKEENGGDPLGVVYDWKTTLEVELPFAREAWDRQLRLYAVAWSALHDDMDVEIRTLQVGPDDVAERRVRLDAMELSSIRGAIRDAVLAYAKGHGDPTPGPHCDGCPSRSICPVGGELALEAIEEIEPTPPAGVAALPVRFALARPTSPAQAAWLWDRIGLAEAFLDGLRAEVRAWVADQPGGSVTLPDGRVAGMFEQSSRSIRLEAPGAYAALAGELGAEVAEEIAPRWTSMAAIERAVRAKCSKAGGGRGTLKVGKERVLAALSAVPGALHEGKATVFRVKKPGKRRAQATPDDQLEAKLRASVHEEEETDHG